MLLLITTPSYDKGTYYLHAWSQGLIEELKKRKVQIFVLEKDKVTKKNLHSYLKKQPVDVVVLNGHGNNTAVAGNSNKEIIVSVGDGDELFKDRNVYIRACSSGAILGHEIMKKGAAGFIGYSQSFMIPHDRDAHSYPLKDDYSAPILECSNQIITSLSKGHTVKEAEEESMRKYEEKFNELSNSKVAETSILPFLLWNMECQVHYSK